MSTRDGLRQDFLDGMSRAACTVNVITTDGPAGRGGVTVSSMTSVSADLPKPALLACIHHLSPAAQLIIRNGAFCVNVLRQDQAEVANLFAGRSGDRGPDRFGNVPWTPGVTSAPRILDALVAFDCSLLTCQQVGTHFVIFGSVEAVFDGGPGVPLVYAARNYRDLMIPCPMP